MTERVRTGRRAGRPARFLGWVLALMLVPLLTGTLYGWMALRAATDQGLHERIALRDAVIDEQMEQIAEEAGTLGTEYSFNPSLVTDALDRDTLTDLNRQVVGWWTKMCATGVPEDMPLWDGETLKEALLENESFIEAHGALARNTAGKIVSALNGTLGRMLFPMREILITEGLEFIRRKVALSEMIDLAQGLPLTLTLLSAAAAGLMLLLTIGDRRTVRRQFGSALGGAGLLSLCVLALIWMTNLEGMIRESSLRLAEQVSRLKLVMGLEALAVTAVLLAAAWLLLRKAGGKPA